MDYQIRNAQVSDHDQIYQLKAESVRPYVEEIWGWDESFQHADFERDFSVIGQFYVIEVDGEFAGFLQYSFHDCCLEVAELHLLPEYRGRGIGSDLLQYFQKICIAQGRKVRLGCFKENRRAKALYARLGFMLTKETGTHYIMEYPNWKIIPYEESYRDDMIFMVLEAKNALGRVPRLNDDLLDIRGHYLDKGDMFWLALDENDRVIGCIGYNSIEGTMDVKLHRFYVKAERKRQGIGTQLLHTAERYLREHGKAAVHVHLGGKEYFESRCFYPKQGYMEYKPDWMKKLL